MELFILGFLQRRSGAVGTHGSLGTTWIYGCYHFHWLGIALLFYKITTKQSAEPANEKTT